ncbi:MAG TPA: FAD-dependent oxidoreductase [Desulfobacteraceae bacterium]|nr:FAD-dependent oxidoreductase [Desulfobacteraceae bacterium]HPJ66520.1 FAD-dependent oxidoreductase [Desulfobacteraceae bacterium]HPQ28509.1 FAD-dependent oxidoreductase [Desulfobacteraceae bacterium]
MDNNMPSSDMFGDVSMFRTCEQCGYCSSACPVTGVNDYNVRRIIRHIELGLIDDIANTPFPWFCTTCGRCESACPNGIAILDIIRPLRKMAPDEFVPDGPPCIDACPAKINIPGYLRLIAEGKPEEAYALILEKVPFPGILGRVCTHPCEELCRRGEVNESVSICALKRFAADRAGDIFSKAVKPGDDTGRKVAVIGAGPAGLSVAFFLRKKGHQVTIFEANSKPGGMMRFGIPYYRLPEQVLDREIDQILGLGIELKTGMKLGRDFNINYLKNEGYDAVFLGLGAQLSRKIELEGSMSDNVLWGIDFLKDISEGKEISLKENVLVVGGGNVAVDVALTALRVGAGKVTMACLESMEEMPANPWEVEMALEEGVEVLPSWGPKRIICNNGNVTGVELVRCTSVFDGSGNFCPAFDETTETLDIDQVILAIGQTTDFSFIDDKTPLNIEKDLIAVGNRNQETSIPGVFAGGDAAEGPGAIIDAVAAGQRAAGAIDKFLGGDGILFKSKAPDTASVMGEEYTGKREQGFADLSRVQIPVLPVQERRNSFAEVDLCFDDEQAKIEAHRCLQCDLELLLAKEAEN